MSIASGCAASTSAACSLRCSIALGPERGMIDRGRRASDFGVGGPANPRDPECRQSPEPLRALPSNSVKFRQILGLPGPPRTARQTSVKVWGVVGPLLPPYGTDYCTHRNSYTSYPTVRETERDHDRGTVQHCREETRSVL